VTILPGVLGGAATVLVIAALPLIVAAPVAQLCPASATSARLSFELRPICS